MTAEPAQPALPGTKTTTTTKVLYTPPPKRTFFQWAATWKPDPRWHAPLCVLLWLVAFGWVPTVWPAVPWWAMLLVTPVAAVAGAVAARLRWPEHRYGHRLAQHGAGLAVLGAVLGGVWLGGVALTGSTPFQAGAWLLVAVGGVGTLFAALDTWAPRVEVKVAEVAAEMRKAIRDESRKRMWLDILRAEGFPQLDVVTEDDTRSGYTLGLANMDPVDMPEGAKPVGFAELREASRRIAVRAAIVMARKGVEFREDWVKFEETPAAHVFRLHVTTENVQTESVPYPLGAPVRSCVDGVSPGLFENGDVISFPLAGVHTVIVGGTGSGKGVLTNDVIASGTECSDLEFWVGATSKLVPLVYPWLKPWFAGETDRPIFGYVAGQDIWSLLTMMRHAVLKMQDRNARLAEHSKHVPTPEEPAIAVIVEEAGTAAKRAEKIRVGSEQMSLSDMIWLICREGRSACVSVLLQSGSALFATFGHRGPEIQRDITQRICLKTETHSDGQQTLNGMRNVNTTQLRNNTFLLQPAAEEPRVLKGKGYHLEATADMNTIHPVAVQNTPRRPNTDARFGALLGNEYRQRWDRDRLPELVRACEAAGYRWPGGGAQNKEPAKPSGLDGSEPVKRDGALSAAERKQWEALEASLSDEGKPPVNSMGNVADSLPTPDETIRRIRESAANAEARANAARADRLPVLLSRIETALNAPNAPKDFVPTSRLAIVLGRVPADATDEDVRKAAEQLGRELSLIDPELRTTQRRQGDVRPRGYEVSLLRTVIERHRHGSPPGGRDG